MTTTKKTPSGAQECRHKDSTTEQQHTYNITILNESMAQRQWYTIARLQTQIGRNSTHSLRGPCTPECDFLTDLGFWHCWNRLAATY
eukprot:SAG11_NODE_6629_length_1276_cov_2.192014_1_plen_87_part_00